MTHVRKILVRHLTLMKDYEGTLPDWYGRTAVYTSYKPAVSSTYVVIDWKLIE